MSTLAPTPPSRARGSRDRIPDSQLTPSRLATALWVERLPGPEALDVLAAEWEALESRLSPRTPFTSPLWNALWWRHFRSDRLLVRDELFVHAVRDGRGRLLAVAPMMITQRPSVGPLRARVLQPFGTDGNVTELRGLVCRPEDEGPAIGALAAHFARTPAGWDWIEWSGLRPDGTGRAHLERAGAHPVERTLPAYHLVLPPTWEQFRSSLSRNIKESLRKCYNSLRREGHEFAVRVIASPAEAPAALGTVFRLHGERGRATGTVRHEDVFADPRARAFISAYAQAMARRGQLRIFQIEIAGQVVATRLGFLLGRELYLYYSGYDLRWGRFSVMTTVVAEAIKWAIGEGLSIVHLSTGHDVSKLRWGPREISHGSMIQLSPGRRAHLAYRAYHDLLRIGRRDSQIGKLLTVARR